MFEPNDGEVADADTVSTGDKTSLCEADTSVDAVAADGTATSNGTGNIHANCAADGHVTDGCVTDGHVTDWHVTDGCVTDGCVTDGHVTQEIDYHPSRDTRNNFPKLHVKITRPAYTQQKFDEGHKTSARRKKTVKHRLKELGHRFRCSGSCAKNVALKHFPFVNVLRGYDVKGDLLSDLIAGLTVGIMHIPQG